MRAALATAAILVACLGHEPGTSLGTYTVTGALKTQTCGAGLADAANPWTFDVRLSKSGELLFWLQAAAPALSGTLDPSGNAKLVTSEAIDLVGADGGVYCAVQRSDTFTAALGTSAVPATFTGGITYHYDVDPQTPLTGPACPGLALPCDVSYDLQAKRQAGN
jgi:hypothetical protein